MNLADLFSDELRQEFAERNIDLGRTILIEIPNFGVTYPKYIVIVAENENEFAIAYVVINSEINNFIFPTPYLKSLHVPIDRASHDFLDHDSFINCTEIREFTKQEVIDFISAHPERVVGNITEGILTAVHATLHSATTIPKIIKVRFGFA
ncbi:MAG: hypothetical protein JKX79_08670 [Labilibaculum sp.]|nr:hypothetical protein [Labilibaculum sp.]